MISGQPVVIFCLLFSRTTPELIPLFLQILCLCKYLFHDMMITLLTANSFYIIDSDITQRTEHSMSVNGYCIL